MLDKTSKIFLSFLDAQHGKQLHYYDDFEFPEGIKDDDSFFAVIRHLESIGLVEYLRSSNDNIYGVRLSHVGMHRHEFSWIALKRYLADKWLEFIALVFAVPAFIMSLIALISLYSQ